VDYRPVCPLHLRIYNDYKFLRLITGYFHSPSADKRQGEKYNLNREDAKDAKGCKETMALQAVY